MTGHNKQQILNYMNHVYIFILKVLKKIYFIFRKNKQKVEYQNYVEIYDQKANDYILSLLLTEKPHLISKFGTIELNTLTCYKLNKQKKYSIKEYFNYIKGDIPCLWWNIGLKPLCKNAGFFPEDNSLTEKYYQTNINAIKNIDILGSYLKNESYFKTELRNAVKVNLDGYYAPFYWNNPWTKYLKNKKVLVVHPFSEEIQQQYAKRRLLWKNPDILPDFKLITYKSVQSMLYTKTVYNNWFEALEEMKKDIASIDFDIAIVGCGAYGMPLSAYIKQIGKTAIHMAGWTQILFGIKGKRWEENPKVIPFINEHWIKPFPYNTPQKADKIEGGCYW